MDANYGASSGDICIGILFIVCLAAFFIYLSNKNRKNNPPTISTALTAGKTAPLALWNCHTIKLPSGLKWNARRTITLFTNLLNILGSGIILRITHESG